MHPVSPYTTCSYTTSSRPHRTPENVNQVFVTGDRHSSPVAISDVLHYTCEADGIVQRPPTPGDLSARLIPISPGIRLVPRFRTGSPGRRPRNPARTTYRF